MYSQHNSLTVNTQSDNVYETSSRAIVSQPKNAGGGSKQASEKQIKFIEGLCIKQKISPDIISQQVCGKAMNEISGSEANAIIKQLNEK